MHGADDNPALVRHGVLAQLVEPELLLLDEPLSALDHANRKALQGELMELQRIWQIPFLLVTHSRKEMAVLADEVLFLEKGRQVRLQPAA
ncbi:MAG TPA: hypothetical protein PLI53_04965 [Geobacteraceae bacterium]|nr:hypothetical protein [Geobacteraceae bacterium]